MREFIKASDVDLLNIFKNSD